LHQNRIDIQHPRRSTMCSRPECGPRVGMFSGRDFCLRWLSNVFLMNVVVLGGCAGSSQLRFVSISVKEDTAAMQQNAEQKTFRVTTVIRNRSSRTLYVGGGCGPEAERQIDNNWMVVWAPMCGGSGPRVVMAGDSAVMQVTIRAFTSALTEPQASPLLVPGQYRLTFQLRLGWPSGNPGLVRYTIRHSSSFVVKDSFSK
jgi:hypothetical protein